jgi:hypothetical protein
MRVGAAPAGRGCGAGGVAAGGVVRWPGSWKSLSCGGPTTLFVSCAQTAPAARAAINGAQAAALRLRRLFNMLA